MAMPDRAPTPGRFGERLAAELDEIEAGLRRSAPQLDASSLQIFGRIGTVATLYRSFYERFLRDTDLTHTEYQVLPTPSTRCSAFCGASVRARPRSWRARWRRRPPA
jgi:hypothetical protein